MYINLHLHMQLRTTTSDNHHTVQVARLQVQYLRQCLDEKEPPAQVAEGDIYNNNNYIYINLYIYIYNYIYIYYIYIYTTTTDHHHTVQTAKVSV